jgi:hypothetical protein
VDGEGDRHWNSAGLPRSAQTLGKCRSPAGRDVVRRIGRSALHRLWPRVGGDLEREGPGRPGQREKRERRRFCSRRGENADCRKVSDLFLGRAVFRVSRSRRRVGQDQTQGEWLCLEARGLLMGECPRRAEG